MPERPHTVIELLGNVSLFDGLSMSQLEQVASRMKRQHYKRGDQLFDIKTKGSKIYVVEEGQIALWVETDDGERSKVLVIERGESFGTLSFFGADDDIVEAVCDTDAYIFEMTHEGFMDILKNEPAIAEQMMGNLARIARNFANRLEAATLLNLEGRLAREILYMRGKRVPSQAGLATLVGASRGAVNAVLSNWRRAGIVKMRWGKLDVMNADELNRRAAIPPERLGTFLRALGASDALIG